ncbi:putative oxidoreductase [Escherichia coli]|nr:putative oxidoreductase [Escherichia coli]
MNVNYLNDSDLDFLQHCSEEQLANFARLLTHNEKGKTRLSSVLMRNELFKSMEGHPEQHRRNWQLIAGELQHFGGDSIANKLRGHGKIVSGHFARCFKAIEAESRQRDVYV